MGARTIDRISPEWLTRAFVAVLVVSAIRLLIPASPEEAAGFVASIDLTLLATLGLLTTGAVAGILAAVLGGGGGIVFVPALAALYSMDQHFAQGTSLAAMVPTTIVAAAAHGRAGRIDWRIAGVIGVGGVIGSLAGAGLALGMDPVLLRRLFVGSVDRRGRPDVVQPKAPPTSHRGAARLGHHPTGAQQFSSALGIVQPGFPVK